MKNNTEEEEQREEFNKAMEESKRNGIQVKVINNSGFIIRGSIGIGLGTLHRAGKIKKYCSLDSLPQSVSREEWYELEGKTVMVPWN